jgi:predicted nuclease with TOPRIM domain
MSVDDVIKAISALGVGSGLGAVVTSVMTTRSTKGKSRAEAADLLVGAAERVGKMNAEYSDEIKVLRNVIADMHLLIIGYLDSSISREQFIEGLKKLR